MGGGGMGGGGGMMGGGGMGGGRGSTGGGTGGSMMGGSTGGVTGGTQNRTQSTTQNKNNQIPTGTYKIDPNVRYSGILVDSADFQRTIDADRDGLITKEEWDRALVKHDTDGDNRLSVEELMTFFPKDIDPSGRHSETLVDLEDFQHTIDMDRDGYITRDEWNRAFDKQDLDTDNRLAVEELRAFFPRDKSRELADAGRLEAFTRLEKNKDGVVDRSEWPGNDKSFRRLDADHDGVISREEFIASSARWWNDIFENLDFKGNGVITRPEWLDSDSSFNRLDRDHNGVITKREFYDPR